MSTAVIAAPIVASRANARPEQAAVRSMGLWPSLSEAWTRRLEQRIEDDLRWLGHTGVLEDFRSASRG